MARKFSIVKKVDSKTGQKTISRYSFFTEEEHEKKMLIRKLNRIEKNDSKTFVYQFDESMYMHILEGISDETVKELSKHIYSNVYVVCKKEGNDEKALYLALFKDTAIRYKNSIPSAKISYKGREYPNPKFFVKEVRLLV